jgi:rhodanese-related sulfurtransferase
MNKIEDQQPKINRRDKYILIGLAVIVVIASILYFVFKNIDGKNDSVKEVSSSKTTPAIETITAPEVQARLRAQDDFILLDIRTRIEYAEEHVAGATNIPLEELEKMKKYLPTDIDIVVMGDGSKCQLSLGGSEKLIDWGFKRIKNFEGGTEAWKAEAYPTTIGVVSEVRFFNIPQLSAPELKTSLDSGIGINLIDVRSALEFSQGHIPGARNISFVDVEALAQANALNLDSNIVIYGVDNPVKSEMAAQILLANGAKEISVLTGGFPAWKAQNYQIQ